MSDLIRVEDISGIIKSITSRVPRGYLTLSIAVMATIVITILISTGWPSVMVFSSLFNLASVAQLSLLFGVMILPGHKTRRSVDVYDSDVPMLSRESLMLQAISLSARIIAMMIGSQYRLCGDLGNTLLFLSDVSSVILLTSLWMRHKDIFIDGVNDGPLVWRGVLALTLVLCFAFRAGLRGATVADTMWCIAACLEPCAALPQLYLCAQLKQESRQFSIGTSISRFSSTLCGFFGWLLISRKFKKLLESISPLVISYQALGLLGSCGIAVLSLMSSLKQGRSRMQPILVSVHTGKSM